MSLVLGLIKLLVLLFLAAGLGLWLFQGRLIFYPQQLSLPDRERYRSREITVVSGGVTLHGWFIGRQPVSDRAPLIIYYGGNAEEVSCNLGDADRFPAGALLFVNYRGYGESGGRPGEEALFRDALTVMDTVLEREKIPASRVVLMGRSLGSGVACHVASRRAVAGVVLVTPFDSLTAVARHYYPVFPVERMLRHRFDSLSLAPSLAMPMLALVAGRDEIIPGERSSSLVQEWAGPVTVARIPGAGHNDIHLYKEYWEALEAFIGTLPEREGDPRPAV